MLLLYWSSQVRISTMVTPDGGKFRGKVPAWRHAKCFLELGWWKEPIEEISGWKNLSKEDQQITQKMLKPGTVMVVFLNSG